MLLIFLFTSKHFSQTLSGYSGFYTIPSANLYTDGTLNFSLHYIDKHYVSFGNYKENAAIYSATLTFLPFLEVNTNFVYLLSHQGTQGIGDRSVGFRLRVLNEDSNFISLAAGLNNIGTAFGGVGAIHKQSIYLVVSKNYLNKKLELTLGRGFKIFKAADYQFIGFFGGFSFKPFSFWKSTPLDLDLIVEYDAERFNGAVRFIILDRIKILAGLMEFKYFSGGVSVSLQL